jgi:DNA-binding beta-propeller fold protein YncE
VYRAGQVQPSLTLNGLTLPVGIAVDKNYDVYVANSGSAPSILVYARAQGSAYKVITSPSIKAPGQIFFDANRDAYFSDEYTGVFEIPYGSNQIVSLGLRHLDATSGIALDPVTGTLFVSNLDGESHVAVYAPGATHPTRTLRNSGNADFLNMATLHNREYVMVPNTSSSDITFYRSSRNKPAFVFSTVANENHGALVKLAGIP